MREDCEDDAPSGDYFTSYDDINVHSLMLKDRPRTLAYKTFIEQNARLFHEKVVIDVGAGTGILSLFAAKSGAKKVYAIEASDIATLCQAIVDKNSLGDVIEVIHGKVETTEKLDGVEADIIVSEWMGFYLFHESMLDTVLVARDRWLKPDGLILPGVARLHLCPVNMTEYYRETFEFWEDVYGFDFSPVVPLALNSALRQPAIVSIREDQLMAEPCILKEIDLKSMKVSEVEQFGNTVDFDICASGKVHGFACWFDVQFTAGNCSIYCDVNENINRKLDLQDADAARVETTDERGRHVDCEYNEFDTDNGKDHGSNRRDGKVEVCLKKSKLDDDIERLQKAEVKDTPAPEAVSNEGMNDSRNSDDRIATIEADEQISTVTDQPVIDHVMSVLRCHQISPDSTTAVTLSTSPSSQPTHWKQTVILLPSPLVVGAGDSIGCRVDMSQDADNKRRYNISVELRGVESESSGDELESVDHPVPCPCQAARCRIIRAVIAKYDEQDLSREDTVYITGAEIDAVDDGYDDDPNDV